MILGLIFLFFCNYDENKSKLKIYIESLTGWMLYLFGMTEILSVFHGLTKIDLIIAWLFYDVVLAFILLWRLRRGKICLSVRDIVLNKSHLPEKLTLFFLAAASLLLAVNTVPYNWDSMTYHLPRIVYWSQNGAVAHYASHAVRQVVSPVLGEFVNLHVYILMDGNDRLLNVLQSVSFITNAALIFGITDILCSGKKGASYLAAFLFMTMPIAFGESLTTQVDQFATLWPLSLAYLLLDYVNLNNKFVWDKKTIADTIYMSSVIAFGYLAKPSVMAAVLVLALWLLVISMRRKDDPVIVIRLLMISAAVIGSLLAPEIGRNLYTFHAVSAPIAGAKQLIGRKNPRYIFVNFLKNFIWNFPSIYLRGSTAIPETLIYRVAGFLRVDINDPGIAEGGTAFAMSLPRDFGHDTAVNPIIFYAAIFSWGWILYKLLFIIKRKRHRKINGHFMAVGEAYSIAVSGSFILFCAILRWEPFVTRYMLTYLALLCPMVVWQLCDWMKDAGRKRCGYILLGAILGLSVAESTYMLSYHWGISDFSSYNVGKERAEKYLYYMSEDYPDYLQVKECIQEQGYRKIGMIMSETGFEYPLLAMLGNDVDRIMHVNVDNETKIYEDLSYHPDCIIALNGGGIDSIDCHGVLYDKMICKNGSAAVFACGDEPQGAFQ